MDARPALRLRRFPQLARAYPGRDPVCREPRKARTRSTTRSTWRAAVTRAATELRATVLRHPWVGPELGQVGLLHVGPNAVRMTSGLLAQFRAAGFPASEEEHAAGALTSYVIGIATSEAAYLSLVARSGVPELEWLSDHSPDFDRETDPQQVREDRFTYGLDRILDGLASRLAQGNDIGVTANR
ncbi:TetR/AcrR family transcriptional regulator C-terminal domain-containing protein [Streptomyces sp. NPDC046716]|uniref:TetR/AcrR family transcriptional regulator C-terminal domain-containing protein n=1 Tax=Streptomyces sp. NPDC046716 TaxID=3157093 RepID=UPI0033DF48CB